ncbi:MAG: WYL domain-containing protein, partial [Clostridia bacterium]|nr:WYL domain-containing protein [Clostridia bacterium]
TTKHTNENIYYSIDKIDEAILSEKKIIFKYFDYDLQGERVFRRDGHRYVANPVTMVFSNDNYYLVCYHDNHITLTNYRIDRMTEVGVLDTPINKDARPKGIDLCNYRKQVFSMFGGKSERVTFEVASKLIDVIYDKFGEKVGITDLGNDKFKFTVDIQISDMFFGWCCSFGDKLKIIAPKEIKFQFSEYLNEIINNYIKE